jgi:hypothetical protein
MSEHASSLFDIVYTDPLEAYHNHHRTPNTKTLNKIVQKTGYILSAKHIVMHLIYVNQLHVREPSTALYCYQCYVIINHNTTGVMLLDQAAATSATYPQKFISVTSVTILDPFQCVRNCSGMANSFYKSKGQTVN